MGTQPLSLLRKSRPRQFWSQPLNHRRRLSKSLRGSITLIHRCRKWSIISWLFPTLSFQVPDSQKSIQPPRQSHGGDSCSLYPRAFLFDSVLQTAFREEKKKSVDNKKLGKHEDLTDCLARDSLGGNHTLLLDGWSDTKDTKGRGVEDTGRTSSSSCHVYTQVFSYANCIALRFKQ